MPTITKVCIRLTPKMYIGIYCTSHACPICRIHYLTQANSKKL